MGYPRRCVHCAKVVNGGNLVRRFDSGVVAVAFCKRCAKSADPYLETDGIRLAIDLCLFRSAAFTHVIFNTVACEGWKALYLVQLVVCIIASDFYYQWHSDFDNSELLHVLQRHKSSRFAFTLTVAGSAAQNAALIGMLLFFLRRHKVQAPVVVRAVLLSLLSRFVGLLMSITPSVSTSRFKLGVLGVMILSNATAVHVLLSVDRKNAWLAGSIVLVSLAARACALAGALIYYSEAVKHAIALI